MNTPAKIVLLLGAAGVGYAAYRWWEDRQASSLITSVPVSVSMPPLGAPPVAAAMALPRYVPPSIGPATESRSGRGHF